MYHFIFQAEVSLIMETPSIVPKKNSGGSKKECMNN